MSALAGHPTISIIVLLLSAGIAAVRALAPYGFGLLAVVYANKDKKSTVAIKIFQTLASERSRKRD
jgi:hypothetical protein